MRIRRASCCCPTACRSDRATARSWTASPSRWPTTSRNSFSSSPRARASADSLHGGAQLLQVTPLVIPDFRGVPEDGSFTAAGRCRERGPARPARRLELRQLAKEIGALLGEGGQRRLKAQLRILRLTHPRARRHVADRGMLGVEHLKNALPPDIRAGAQVGQDVACGPKILGGLLAQACLAQSLGDPGDLAGRVRERSEQSVDLGARGIQSLQPAERPGLFAPARSRKAGQSCAGAWDCFASSAIFLASGVLKGK